MKTKLLASTLLLVPVLGAAQSRYVLRYTESEPLKSFLSRYSLRLEGAIPNRPIYSVVDPLGRPAKALIGLISDDTDDDVSIERDQLVRLPIHSLARPQTQNFNLMQRLLGWDRYSNFFGRALPVGYTTQTAVNYIQANSSWVSHGIGTGLIAVVDTGVDFTHPALANHVALGFDYINANGNGSELTGLPNDIAALINPTTTPLLLRPVSHLSNATAVGFERQVRLNAAFNRIPIGLGHGTMVAGAIRLVAPGARILPIRAFDQAGNGRLFNVLRAIHAAEDRGAKVVNLSLNVTTYSPELDRTCDEVSSRGLILVASAGNNGLINSETYPAALNKVTAVASISYNGLRSSFSNAGNYVTVSAPGEGMMLPFPGNRWAAGWGTSFSAPLVSGLAAKILQYKPDATYSDLQSILGKSSPLPDPNLGFGGLNIWSSMNGL